MSNNYGYGYPDPNEGGGNYSYPTDAGPYQRYPVGPQAGGPVQPQNLGWKMGQKGKIGTNSTASGYYDCAHWGWRALAGLIDYGPLVVLDVAVRQIATSLVYTIGADLAEAMVVLTWVVLAGVAVLNSGVLQGLTSQSIGKKVLGMQVVRGVIDPDGDKLIVRPGVPWGVARLALHVVDAFPCYLGYFAPLWTWRRQTFADMIANTAVLKEPELIALMFAPSGSRKRKL